MFCDLRVKRVFVPNIDLSEMSSRAARNFPFLAYPFYVIYIYLRTDNHETSAPERQWVPRRKGMGEMR